MSRSKRSWAGLFGAAIGILTALYVARSEAATAEFRDLRIEVVGDGRPVVLIPGLNSAAATWTETCAALQPGVQCHIVQLPGFAGAPAVAADNFQHGMRDRLLAYLDDRQLERPVVIGHSLGGTLALQMAAEKPGRIERLVIVDALPFLAGLRGMTPEAARGMAAGMRQQMLSATPVQWEAGTRQGAAGMSRSPANTERVVAWGLASDRATTAQAMSELWGEDLRPLLPRITAPTLVLGAWAAYEPMGATLESTRRIFETQYAGLNGAKVAMSQRGHHFLMWDDADWLVGEVKGFLATK
ncbi:pimeloyl-ACP methyl ester carboxylesterase [Pelomonas aquatica]|uniref:Pimeloyl-ACP methyl ester carboxylesterase n=1 Tax=Pelomonas aquatica TaxID=431058 RepID=A0ABU1ZCG6_9BURK|nr:alpha/beta hydrolase [Pelomonas aquatica]MDR7297366.1 pimeloyl-ACP methyl ester carboxylesterase [Pelomonas aquatica]